jgi:hypothetical protein
VSKSVSTVKTHAREKPLPSPLACLWLELEEDEDDEERDISKFPGDTNGRHQSTSADEIRVRVQGSK